MWVRSEYGPPQRRVLATKNQEKLTALLEPIMLRRTLESTGMNVPPMSWVPLSLTTKLHSPPPPTELMSAARTVRAWIDTGVLDETPALATLRRMLGLTKVKPVVDVVAEAIEGEGAQIVLFAHHRDVIAGLADGLAKYGPGVIHGGTPEKQRWQVINAFNEGRIPVFIGQNRAVSEGIPLHAAATAIIVEPDWTATVNHQLSQRIVALGQTTPKVVQFAMVADSIDEAIVRQHIRETEMQEVLG
jgi:SWI/SNF-related matrix-associated actin-dependent regulator 1 of chromatin subfamily A